MVDSLDNPQYNKHMNKTNELIQWAGTAFILAMYVISNFFPGYDDLRNAVALVGAGCFFAWSWRVANKQQTIVNVTGVTITLIGLFRALG
jgi:cytosine/uracil/thiamine/allantoin permease